MTWLIDTNCWISFLKGRNPEFGDKLVATPAATVFTCAPVLAELLHGARKYGDPAARELKVSRLLAPYSCLPFDAAAAAQYAVVRHNLEKQGNVIGPFDLQIAAIALANDLVVVTSNVNEFSRVPGLKLESWGNTHS